IPMSFYYAGTPHQLDMRFSKDVGATLGPGDMIVQDLGSPANYDSNLTYDPGSRDAAFAMQGAGILPQGNYRAVLNAAGRTAVACNPVTGTTSMDFFVLPGDANHDRHVDLTDFTILATNFNQTNR